MTAYQRVSARTMLFDCCMVRENYCRHNHFGDNKEDGKRKKNTAREKQKSNERNERMTTHRDKVISNGFYKFNSSMWLKMVGSHITHLHFTHLGHIKHTRISTRTAQTLPVFNYWNWETAKIHGRSTEKRNENGKEPKVRLSFGSVSICIVHGMACDSWALGISICSLVRL